MINDNRYETISEAVVNGTPRDNSENISNKDIFVLLQEIIKQNKESRDAITLEIQKLKEDVAQDIKLLRQENQILKAENEQLEKRVLEAERKSKKFNLIFYGLEEQHNEISDIQKLLHVVNENLQIDCKYTDLRDIYRLGKPSENKTRPVAIEVFNYALKTDILKNTKKLKGSGIYISHDYIKEDYEERKILYSNFKEAKKNGFEAKIQKGALIMRNKTYSVEELKSNPITLTETCEVFETREETIKMATSSKTNSKDSTKRKFHQTDSEGHTVKRSNRLASKTQSISE